LGWVRLLDEWGTDIVPAVRVGADGTARFHLYGQPVDTVDVRAAYQGTLNENGYTPSRSPVIPVAVTKGTRSARPDIDVKLSSTTTARYPTSVVVKLSKSKAPTPTGRLALYSQYDGNLFLGYLDIGPDGTAATSFEPGLSK